MLSGWGETLVERIFREVRGFRIYDGHWRLAFDPDTRQVVLAGRLKGTDYGHLAGDALHKPANASHRPGSISLAQRLGAMTR